MFFLMGITNGRKDLNFNQVITCPVCGLYSNYHVYMTYMVLSLFFIPCFKWNRQYYVETGCCHTVYGLDKSVGKRIARGEQVQIQPEDLQRLQNAGYSVRMRKCSSCGFRTLENYDFCPKCGQRLL